MGNEANDAVLGLGEEGRMIHDPELQAAVDKQRKQFDENAPVEAKEATLKEIQRIQERIKNSGGGN
jgi:hypothetical protein